MGIRHFGRRQRPAPPDGDEAPGAAARVLSRMIERSARLQGPAVRAYLRRLRDARPGAGPAEIVGVLEKRYRAAVVAGGVAVGSLAAVPGIGTLMAFSVIAVETAFFLEVTALLVLALAEVHAVPADSREQRRALVLAALVGSAGRPALADLLGPGRTSGAWLTGGSTGAASLPAMSELNTRLLRHFVRRYSMRRGALTFGKLLPMGLGAVVGGVGNRIIGNRIIGNTRAAFGDPPTRWPTALHLVPPLSGGDDAGGDRLRAPVRLADRRAGD